jgi:hypothetical protein
MDIKKLMVENIILIVLILFISLVKDIKNIANKGNNNNEDTIKKLQILLNNELIFPRIELG